MDSGTQDPALWAKAMALAEGDEGKAKYRYIALRVEEFSNASVAGPPEDPAPIVDSSDDGLRSAPDSRSPVEYSASPESKADAKPIPEGWVPPVSIPRRKGRLAPAGVFDMWLSVKDSS